MSKPKLTNWDFCESSKKLKCEVAAIKAVAHVESRGDGFYDNGFPTILFERHKFRKFTRGRYNATHPHLSGPQGGYGKAGQNQINKFNEAFRLDPEAAMESCSWGKFQVMGFNWEDLGYDSIHEFVDLMKTGEAAHLDSFVRFVIKNGLADELRRKDFTTFARIYNGAEYRKNRYDTKMKSAYERFVKENIDCSKVKKVSAAGDPADSTDLGQPTAVNPGTIIEPDETPLQSPPPLEPAPVDQVTKTEVVENDGTKETVTVTTKNEQDVNVPAQVASTQYQGVGFFGVLKKDLTVVTGGNLSFQGLQEYATQASGWPPWVISIITKIATIAIVIGIGWLLYRLFHYVIWKIGDWQRQKLEANINSDVTKKNIEFTS